jgi:curved DNA-binding protein CbpA
MSTELGKHQILQSGDVEIMNKNSLNDYYEDLQVSSNADIETIERVYRLLAKRYHPDNNGTGNAEKFNIITTAYRELSDPVKRAAFDVKYEKERIHQFINISKASCSEGFETDRQIRHSILSILYVEIRKDPTHPGIGLWQLEKFLGWPEKILEFHTWYLKEKGWIKPTDTGGYAITASGVDVVEENELTLGKDRLITYNDDLSKNTENSENSDNNRKTYPKMVEQGI